MGMLKQITEKEALEMYVEGQDGEDSCSNV